jgi:hypothetical protein
MTGDSMTSYFAGRSKGMTSTPHFYDPDQMLKASEDLISPTGNSIRKDATDTNKSDLLLTDNDSDDLIKPV